jgi:hypothetical protein
MDLMAAQFLTSALDGGEWLAVRSGCLTSFIEPAVRSYTDCAIQTAKHLLQYTITRAFVLQPKRVICREMLKA